MKRLILLIFILISLDAKEQRFCIDSSSHFRYGALPGDSFQVEKAILCKDGSKIYMGVFLIGPDSGKPFICKIEKGGKITWVKKITSPFTNGAAEMESIEEASNGNIFVAVNSVQPDNKPFFYLVFSPGGNLLYQNKFGITNNLLDLSNAFLRMSLISRFGTDSMLFVLIHPVNTTTSDGMTLLTVSNDGHLGQGVTYAPPIITTHRSYYNRCKIQDNHIFLYGSTLFWNSCQVNSFEQPAFAYLNIDWSTKRIVDKKAFCSPSVGDTYGYFNSQYDQFPGNNFRGDILYQANGNIIVSRTYMGLEYNGSDTLNRLFSVSEFDDSFNHIKSEYITAGNQFKRDCDYELRIDSLHNFFIRIHDLPNKEVYYAAGNDTESYYWQRKFSFPLLKKNPRITRQNFVEPGYFASFSVISSDNDRSYIDNIRILRKDTAASCFGENAAFLNNKPANVSAINWSGDFIFQQAIVESSTPHFIIEDYPLQQNTVCNIVHKCDTLKINGPGRVCIITEPIYITAYKNPLCSGKIDFIFDTAAVQAYSQLNDTTLSLIFNKSYRGFIYALSASCDRLIDSLEIQVIAPRTSFSLGKDTLYCPGKNYLLTAYDQGFKTYSWQDGSTGSTFLATTSGVYQVRVTDYCDRVYADTIRIIQKDFKIDLGRDSTVCINENMVLSVPAGYLNYSWQPQNNLVYVSEQSIKISPTENTSVSVDAEVFPGCHIADTVNIIVKNCSEYIYFPSGFTPNNDGLNDTFKPFTEGALENYELKIFNRWGQLIFHTRNKNEGWTGKFQEISQDNGTFVWQCRYKFYNKREKIIKGVVTMVK